MLDLDTNFDTLTRSNEGAPCTLKDLKTGKPTEVVITLLGMDSERFQEIKTERSRDMAERAARGNFEPLDEDQKLALHIDTLARCTVGWSGMASKGEEIPFSVEKARWLYRAYPAIREQVNVFIGDRANFLPA